MAEESSESLSEEKKHEATPRKRERAREEGRVARAPDFAKLVLMAVFFLLALLPGSLLASSVLEWGFLALDHAGRISLGTALEDALYSLGALSALLIVLSAFGALGALVPGGWSPSIKPIIPDPERLDPVKGLKNMFSPKRLTETLKALLKFVVLGGAGVATFMLWRSRIDALPNATAPDWAFGLRAIVWILGVSVLAAAVLVAIDTPLQAWFHRRELRMTDQELRDELKENEIKPEVRRRQRQAQARAARARMMEQLPQASAVVVNPSHYAAAFRYRRERDSAPVLIATGAGPLAARICKIARRHGIPIVKAPPLARALFFHGVLGERVPTTLYQACAEVLAYVWRLHLWASGQGREPAPPAEADLGVDARLDPLAPEHGGEPTQRNAP